VGLAFGVYHLPTASYGPEYSGALRATSPETFLAELEAARRTNTRVLVSFAGSDLSFTDEQGHFSMTIWKAKVARFAAIDFSSYIADGTLLGHYIMDEPSDRSNWGGEQVSPADIEETARYSKELWPTLPTVIRAWTRYLQGYEYPHLDAAWAQYHERFGPIEPWLSANVRDAVSIGLNLVVGLNVLGGGGEEEGLVGIWKVNSYSMNASQVRTWGAFLLAEPRACAFISWMYHPVYFARPDIIAANAELLDRARSLPKRGCGRS
jgi:hypothetical protein